MDESQVPLPGSECAEEPTDTSTRAGRDERVEATVVLRRRAEPTSPQTGAIALTSEELGERYGADPADIDRVRTALSAVGAEVIAVDAPSRRMGSPPRSK